MVWNTILVVFCLWKGKWMYGSVGSPGSALALNNIHREKNYRALIITWPYRLSLSGTPFGWGKKKKAERGTYNSLILQLFLAAGVSFRVCPILDLRLQFLAFYFNNRFGTSFSLEVMLEKAKSSSLRRWKAFSVVLTHRHSCALFASLLPFCSSRCLSATHCWLNHVGHANITTVPQ